MVQKAKTRVLENEVFLCYYEEGTGKARILGKAYDLGVRGHAGRLNKTAQKAVEMNPGVMFFLMEGGGNMGLRGLDALKQGDDREPEDTSEDVENAPPVVDE